MPRNPQFRLKYLLVAVMLAGLLSLWVRYERENQYVSLENLISAFNQNIALVSDDLVQPATMDEVLSCLKKWPEEEAKSALQTQRVLRGSSLCIYWEAATIPEQWSQCPSVSQVVRAAKANRVVIRLRLAKTVGGGVWVTNVVREIPLKSTTPGGLKSIEERD